MSLNQTVIKVVDDVIQMYISKISEQYNLNQNELYALWTNNIDIKMPTKSSTQQTENSELLKLGKQELIEICKSKGVRHTGTKADLIERLSQTEKTQTIVSKTVKKATVVNDPPVIKNLVAKIPIVPIRRNQFGNFEHAETSFIFNNKTQKVIGKQNNDGTVDELTSEDINLCNKYKFSFDLPSNLDKKTNLEDVQVEDLDDDDEEEFVEEEEEEEDDENEDDEEENEEFEEEDD